MSEQKKRPGVIPVGDAREMGQKRKCPMVVVFAIEQSGDRFTVTTWGKTRELCQLAAGYGEDIAKAVYGGSVIPRQTPDGLIDEPTVTEWRRDAT